MFNEIICTSSVQIPLVSSFFFLFLSLCLKNSDTFVLKKEEHSTEGDVRKTKKSFSFLECTSRRGECANCLSSIHWVQIDVIFPSIFYTLVNLLDDKSNGASYRFCRVFPKVFSVSEVKYKLTVIGGKWAREYCAVE